MHKLILLLLCLLLSGCTTTVPEQQRPTTQINGATLTTYTIEGCEYLGYAVSFREGVLTHKGNCKNPIHSK